MSGAHSRKRFARKRRGERLPVRAQPAKPAPAPASGGPRRAALATKKREQLRRKTAAGVAFALVAAASTALVATIAVRRIAEPEPTPRVASVAPEDTIDTLLVFGTREGSDPSEALWTALLYYDKTEDSGGVIYIPAHVATEVPGRGLHALTDALSSGGIPLLLVSAENLLGIDIDQYLELSDKDALLLAEEIGELTVNVPLEVRVHAGRGRTRLMFAEGPQLLDPRFVVALLYRTGAGSDDVELGNRHLAFWDGLLEHYAGDPTRLADVFEIAAPALLESNASASEQARLFERLASLGQGELTLGSLPVSQLSVGGDELYQADAEELDEFLDDTLGETRAASHSTRIQVLNGNGVPGIGQEVATKLIGHGFQVVLSGNAPRLNYKKTLIVTYDASPEGREIADKARELLGVGEVQISAQEQGIVDLTIVIGKDFLRVR